MSQAVWRVAVHGRQNAQSGSYDTTYFVVSVATPSKERAKAAALAYVSLRGPYLDEPGPYRVVRSHLQANWPDWPRRTDGEVVALEVNFTGR
jgi:hypothetical protein